MKYDDEFPLLRPQGLYPAEIIGDGNCLFSALSDQLFGKPDRQHDVRAATIAYMRANADLYKPFLAVHAGGGTRRNPRRRNVASASQEDHPPTEADIDRAFENHLKQMSKGGVYGDNHEIVAFCSTFRVAVKIYEKEFAYMVGPQDRSPTYTCHIAHHPWEHYSSIRNIDGPHSGWPCVEGQGLPPEESQAPSVQPPSPSEQHTQHHYSHPPVSPYKEAWKINLIEQSLPYTVDRATIIRSLEEHAGDVDTTVEKLISVGYELPSSQSGRSSSPDSSDSYSIGTPKKKQDRRHSRASKSARRQKMKEDSRRDELAARIQGTFRDSLEDLENATITTSFTRPPTAHNWRMILNTDDEKDSSPPPNLKDGNTSESSVYSEAPSQATSQVKAPILKLKHTPAASKALPSKRLGSSRDIKIAKKREQKLAAKERKLANSGSGSSAGNKRPLDQLNSNNVPTYPQAPAMVKTTSNPGITTAIRTLHV